MFLYKILDYPAIPDYLIEQFVPDTKIGEYPSRVCFNGTDSFKTSTGIFYHADSAINKWVEENINVDIDRVGVRYQYGLPDESCHGAHSDATRDYSLLYIVDAAGGEITFWQQENKPAETDSVVLVTDYSKLSKLESVTIPNGSWYVINGRVIHSVENLTGTRVSVQINLNSLEKIL